MDIKEAREELLTDFKTKSVKLKWGFGEITFERADFLAIWEVHDCVEAILNQAFVEKWVMHYDLRKEDPVRSYTSLAEVAAFLQRQIDTLRGRLPKQTRALIQTIEHIRSECVVFSKRLRQLHEEIEEGNKGEFESEYKVRPPDWIPGPLGEFRLRVYPHFKVLIDTLPDDSTVRVRALEYWLAGVQILTDEEKFKVIPVIRKDYAA